MDTYINDNGSGLHIEYVDLAGVLGVFVQLDAAQMDETNIDTVQVGLGHHLRQLIHANRQGTLLQKELYIRSSERARKGRQAQCRYCEEVYHCRPDLASHQARAHPELPARPGRRARRACPQCGKMVINLGLHVRNKHEQDAVVQDGMSQCRQCADTYQTGTDHLSVCRLSPVCPDCNKTFSQWRVMNKHRRIVHMGIKITCPHCSKHYHDSQSLKKHIDAVHLKIKRLCPLCGASVTALAVHMNSVHTGAKNFACTTCGKKFKSNYDLNRHRDTVHLGNKPVCPYCGKNLANIRQHIRVVHKKIRFPCQICKKLMTTKAELRKHIAKAHYNSAVPAAEPVIEQRQPDNPAAVQQGGDAGGSLNVQQGGDAGGSLNVQHQKELSDDQLLAQYFGKQHFTQLQAPRDADLLPEQQQQQAGHGELAGKGEHGGHQLVVKPDLEHLLAARQVHQHSVKSEVEHLLSGRAATDPVLAATQRQLSEDLDLQYTHLVPAGGTAQHAVWVTPTPAVSGTQVVHTMDRGQQLHKLKQNV